jgi:hypothetical protein
MLLGGGSLHLFLFSVDSLLSQQSFSYVEQLRFDLDEAELMHQTVLLQIQRRQLQQRHHRQPPINRQTFSMPSAAEARHASTAANHYQTNAQAFEQFAFQNN